MKRMLPLLFLLAMASGAASDGLAFTGDLKKDPSLTVKAYLDLDMKGARLDAMSWETLKPYINWKREISWGIVDVIDGYEIVEDVKAWEIIDILEVVIPVKYRVLGTMDWDTASYTSEPHVEEVRFRVKAVGDRWRIMEPMLPPHVGQKRLINHVRHAMLQETDGGRLAKLAELRDSLKKGQK